MNKVKLHLGYSGYCMAKENHTIKGGGHVDIKFFALWGLIKHPTQGYILFDTGYTKRFFEATKRYPNKLYAKLTKVFLNDDDTVKEQLRKNNIDCNDINHIIISHFHADHVGGLKDFQNAQLHVSQAALDHVNNISKSLAFSKGVLTDLIPSDLNERAFIIEEHAVKLTDPIFSHKYDLFGDETIMVFNLGGHAAGQIGILLETEKDHYFLVADACWNMKAITEDKLPSPIVRLFFDSWKDYKESIAKLKTFHSKYQSVKIVPTHCAYTTEDLVANQIFSNEL